MLRRTPLLSAMFLLATVVACDEPAPTPAAPSASASEAAAPSALLPPPALEVNREGERKLEGTETVILLTINEAREVLYAEGWGRAGGARSPSGFVLSKAKDGKSVRIQWTRFNDGEVSEPKLAALTQNAVWSMENKDAAVAVQVKNGDAVDVDASTKLLKKLVIRGADDTPTFTLVPSTPKTKLRPKLDADGKAMAKEAVDAVIAALAGAGHADAKVTEEQKHDPEGTKVAMPSATITAGGGTIEVMIRCSRPRVPLEPKPVDAGVGGAITLQGTCSVVVWVDRTDDKPSDKAKAEALLKKLLG